VRRLLALGLAALTLLMTACTPRAADHEQIATSVRMVAKFSHVTAENSPKHLAALHFAQAAGVRSGGRFELQVYPNSQLYRDGEDLVALRNGEIEFVAVAPSKLTDFDPDWQVYDLPYLFSSFSDVERLFNSPVGMKMRDGLERQGMVALAIWPNGFKELTNRRRPLVAPADFAGLTFRVQAQVLSDQFAAVDARAVLSGFDAVYSNLEHGQVDGQENTLNNIYTRNLTELQPYLTISDHGYLPYVVLVRKAWWQSLDPALRDQVQAGLDDATAWIRDNAQAINEDALKRITESGLVQVHVMTLAEREVLRVAFQPAYRAATTRLGAPFMNEVITTVRGG
jgi:C4-dicarboxylate-binding protein DctP